MIISIENSLVADPTTQFSFTSSAVSAAGTVVPVKNGNIFRDGWAVQFGKTGESQSEIKIISGAPTSGTINLLAVTTYDHAQDTPVYQIHYDQIIVKRSTSGTAGTAVAIGTTNITPNSLYTEYNDSSGTTGYAYKTQFFNSSSSDTSSESDWFIPGGPAFYSLQAIRQRGKDSLYNASYLKDDSVVDDWINEWIEVMTNSAIKVNQAYSIGTASYSFGADGTVTITAEDFKTATKIETTYDGTNYANSAEIPMQRFSSGDTFLSSSPKHSWQGDTTFIVLPANNGGTARITYSKLATRMVNDSDNLPLSLRSYTGGCIEYLLYKAFDQDLKRDYAESHYGKFKMSKQDFISEITPRDQSGPKTIFFTDSLSGRDDTVDLISDFIS